MPALVTSIFLSALCGLTHRQKRPGLTRGVLRTTRGGANLLLRQRIGIDYRGIIHDATFLYRSCSFPEYCRRSLSSRAVACVIKSTDPVYMKIRAMLTTCTPAHDAHCGGRWQMDAPVRGMTSTGVHELHVLDHWIVVMGESGEPLAKRVQKHG